MTSRPLPGAELGRTGLRVSRLGYGAMELRGPDVRHGRPVTDEAVRRLLVTILDLGINVIDTAPDYGQSEELIGRHLAHRRHEFVVATKCGCSVGEAGGRPGAPAHIWTREHIVNGVHASLRRLRTEYVDVVQLHNPPANRRVQGEAVPALLELRRQGKVRWIGVSSRYPDLPTFLAWNVFDVVQLPYSALERAHEECLAKVHRAGAGTIVHGGVARGSLARSARDERRWDRFVRAGLDDLRDEGESRAGFLLRYALTASHVDTIAVGTLSEDHVRENVRATRRGPLSAEVYEEARRRLARVGVTPLNCEVKSRVARWLRYRLAGISERLR